MLVLVLIPAIYPYSPGSFQLQFFISVREEVPAGSPTHGRPDRTQSTPEHRQRFASVDKVMAEPDGGGLDAVAHFQLLVDGAEVCLDGRLRDRELGLRQGPILFSVGVSREDREGPALQWRDGAEVSFVEADDTSGVVTASEDHECAVGES